MLRGLPKWSFDLGCWRGVASSRKALAFRDTLCVWVLEVFFFETFPLAVSLPSLRIHAVSATLL